jgi:hypothetical protein
MKRAALAVMCLALAGCGAEEDVGESGSCADGLLVNGELYVGIPLAGPDPKAGGPVEGGVQPGCNDGGPHEPDREIGVREVSGVPPEVAVYREWSTRTTYLNAGYPTELPEHPLHDRIHGSPDRPRRPARGRPCRLDGEVTHTWGYPVVGVRERTVILNIDARTRVTGFDRGGLTYFERGDRLRVHGRGCARDVMHADRIEPQP